MLFLGTIKKAWVLWSTHRCCGGEHGAGRTCGKRCGMQSTSRQRRATELPGRVVLLSSALLVVKESKSTTKLPKRVAARTTNVPERGKAQHV
jgi:hypothetical protein